MRKRIREFINSKTSQFFQNAFDNNSGIHSTQRGVREIDDLKLNSSNQERNNEERVIGHNKYNTNINKVHDNSEISAITNCINDNFENINNSAMKNTGSQ